VTKSEAALRFQYLSARPLTAEEREQLLWYVYNFGVADGCAQLSQKLGLEVRRVEV
jgi:hypothetical protein